MVFTLLFNGGLVPTYLMYTSAFNVKNTIFALIVPNLLMHTMNVLLMRTYYSTSIPAELFEASEIDGAGNMQQLIYITFPMIRQTIIIVMLLVITGCFKIFEIVYQLTGGGPNHMSDLLVTYMYYSTFTSSRYGYGMSIASVTFLISALFAVIYLYVTREQVGEEE